MRKYKTPNLSSHTKTGQYAFSNIKIPKKLSFFSVAEAHGLIYPRPLGENFSFACLHNFRIKKRVVFLKQDVHNILLVHLMLGSFFQDQYPSSKKPSVVLDLIPQPHSRL